MARLELAEHFVGDFGCPRLHIVDFRGLKIVVYGNTILVRDRRVKRHLFCTIEDRDDTMGPEPFRIQGRLPPSYPHTGYNFICVSGRVHTTFGGSLLYAATQAKAISPHETVMDVSGSLFHIGVSSHPRPRGLPSRVRVISPVESGPPSTFSIQTWEDRAQTLVEPGKIRILNIPVPSCPHLAFMWYKDYTLTEWLQSIETENPISAALRPADYLDRMKALFHTVQRRRWLARIVLQRWTQRIWRKRTQCNVDLIEMGDIPDADAVFLTDTKIRTIYRFHRRDMFSNLLTNICMSDEMLPTPRYPTNPWTNATLTLAQTIGLCQQLAADFGRRGRCPPVLFAAFWAARFNLKQFQEQNSSLLAQHAVTSYFKDLHEYNQIVVQDTIVNLLTATGLNYSQHAIRRWLRQTPVTPLHREWLELVRDYTLYMNLHVQVRVAWYSPAYIHADVRELYSRTSIQNPPSQRMQALASAAPNPAIPDPAPMYGFLSLPLLLQPNGANGMSHEDAMFLLQNAFYFYE